MDINNACLLIKCLKEWVASLRNRFSDFEAETKSLLLSETGYKRNQQRNVCLKWHLTKIRVLKLFAMAVRTFALMSSPFLSIALSRI